MFTFIIACMLIGVIVGFLASLFGIGGGTVIVPVLLYFFSKLNMPSEHLMQMALGTSFAIIIITSISSSYQHYKLKNIDFNVFKIFVIPLIISVYISARYFVNTIPQHMLKLIFAVLMFYISIKMLIPKPKPANIQPKFTLSKNILGGSIIGIISSLAGIGGGAFMVPFFNKNGLEMKKAIATSSCCGIFLATMGAIGFIISGLEQSLPKYSFGYVYIPAVIAMSSTILIASKFGASLASKLPTATLKKYFATFLACIAVYMIIKTYL